VDAEERLSEAAARKIASSYDDVMCKGGRGRREGVMVAYCKDMMAILRRHELGDEEGMIGGGDAETPLVHLMWRLGQR
jgi:hypothetical protein